MATLDGLQGWKNGDSNAKENQALNGNGRGGGGGGGGGGAGQGQLTVDLNKDLQLYLGS